MKNILVIGAGRSSISVINYLLEQAKTHQWFVTVADARPDQALERVNNHPNGRGTWLEVLNPNDRKDIMMRADVVVSLLPPHLHYRVARDCIKYNKKLVTNAYVNRDLYRLNPEIINAPLFFMGEMGLDPGLDYFSAQKLVNEIREKGGKITSLRSYTGGLVNATNSENPWKYKFSWNPRNMIIAGQGISQYQIKGKYKYMSYDRLFKNPIPIEVPEMGEMESYADRDSLLFRSEYGLDNIPTLKRSTLRHKGFCHAWDALIRLGLTDDTYPILESNKMTYRDLLEAYLVGVQDGNTSLKDRIAQSLGENIDSPVMEKLDWLGLFERRKINLNRATPARILGKLLEDKWRLAPKDEDIVVIMNVVKYRLRGKNYKHTNHMILKGDSASEETAMSKVVGLPVGIAVKLLMEGRIPQKGIQVPITKEFYEPTLEEL
ncbi:MAG: saccharopine dehydrogenase C-terminal domain-containing protein, partial [Saprospiraceae bacterium]